MKQILFNGQFINNTDIINIEDRGYQFGDGIYEVIGVYDGKPFLLDEHLERLARSATELQLALPFTVHDLKRKLLRLVFINGLGEGIIYLQVTRGVAARWHEFPSEDTAPVTVAYTRPEKRMTEVEDQGATAVLTEDIRWLRCDIKTLNLLPNVLAKQKADENNAIEAILHRGGIVTEASASNVFIIIEGVLYTHPANNYILSGITRNEVIRLCDELNIKVYEETFTIDELLAADEVFITATKLDVVPIINIDGRPIGDGTPGEMTRAIIQRFRSQIEAL